MDFIDNKNYTLKEDLIKELKAGSKLVIAAVSFSMFAFEALKEELRKIDELRFIFTSELFTEEQSEKQTREFYIPKHRHEQNLFGTEFEVKLRNELTQKAIAKECADWIREKAVFKSNISGIDMQRFVGVNDKVYIIQDHFSTVELGVEKGNSFSCFIPKLDDHRSLDYLNMFDEVWTDRKKAKDVTDAVIDSISTAYKENAPEFIYYLTLCHIFSAFLEDISEDELPNEKTGYRESKIWKMLYNFQRDAAQGIINKLEKYNGCILADSVGLGKTFTALAVIKYYENRNKSVLVLCPKKLANNWNTYKDNYLNNPIAQDRLRYDVLFHTDLSRSGGRSNGLDLDRLNWSNYDLVVIDESHNFRNGGKFSDDEDVKENRYMRLMNKVIKQGVKTKVLMLSATPVNNRFTDLRNQLALAYEGDSDLLDAKLNTKRSISEIFRSAQTAFNSWSGLPADQRTTESLLNYLDFDFFELLDSVTIARSRKHIRKYYDMSDIGGFPKRLKPISLRPNLTDLQDAINYDEIFKQLINLNLSVYTPTHYILDTKLEKYSALYGDNKVNRGFTQANRERGIRRLMAINLLKRLESSVYAFKLTLARILALIEGTIAAIDQYDAYRSGTIELTDISGIANTEDLDSDDENMDELFMLGKKVKIDLADMNYIEWRHYLEQDKEELELLKLMINDISPAHDSKLQELLSVIRHKIEHPINTGNRKIIIFTAFADTAKYLYEQISGPALKNFGMNTAMVTGSVEGRSTAKNLRTDLNTVLTCFSPVSKDKDLLMPDDDTEIDILIATDCISEGQNLQDCDYLINYDIHWNPVRIIQRFGRIDRIGSHNACIQLVNFWPNVSLDEYIDLKARVESRMKIVDMTATGDDNLLNEDEKIELEYRKNQLRRLQDEVMDIEDMGNGISIVDLGLNEFRMDLLEYIKHHPKLDQSPLGLHTVVRSEAELPPGVIYILKNCSNDINIDQQNRLHPFYMVYVSQAGDVVFNHLSPKPMLDNLKYLCKGHDEPIDDLCRAFNHETRDGKKMELYSKLLGDAITSIIHTKDENDLDAFLSGAQMSFSQDKIKGLDDFELITFFVVR